MKSHILFILIINPTRPYMGVLIKSLAKLCQRKVKKANLSKIIPHALCFHFTQIFNYKSSNKRDIPSLLGVIWATPVSPGHTRRRLEYHIHMMDTDISGLAFSGNCLSWTACCRIFFHQRWIFAPGHTRETKRVAQCTPIRIIVMNSKLLG